MRATLRKVQQKITAMIKFIVRVKRQGILPKPAAEVVKAMTPKGVVPGYPLGKHYPGMENVLLLSCTEANNRTQIDKLAEIMGGLL